MHIAVRRQVTARSCSLSAAATHQHQRACLGNASRSTSPQLLSSMSPLSLLPSVRRYSSAPSGNLCLGESMTLADGRTLGFHLHGDPNGIPVFYIHGVVDSGTTLEGKEDEIGKAMGIRWVAPDRPGIGKSTFQPRRSIPGYTDDIRQLINHLGLKEYYILGVSGGAPYTLACAKGLPRKQLRGAGICAGVAPWNAGRRGQDVKTIFQMYLMKYWPTRVLKSTLDNYVPLACDPDPRPMYNRFREDLLPWMDATTADATMQSDAMKSAVRVYRQYYAQGIDGHMEDMRLITRPWGFRVEDVDLEGMKLWYGGADINTPPSMGLYLARRLPKSIYKEYAGENHASLLASEGPHLPGILRELIADA